MKNVPEMENKTPASHVGKNFASFKTNFLYSEKKKLQNETATTVYSEHQWTQENLEGC